MNSTKGSWKETFRELGFTNAHLKCYLKFLKDASENSGIAELKIRAWSGILPPIKDLVEWGLLVPYKDSTGLIKVRPIPPEIGINAFYSKKLWEICDSEEDLSKMPKGVQKVIRKIRDQCKILIAGISNEFNFLKLDQYQYGEIEKLRMVPMETISAELSMLLLCSKQEIRGVTVPRWAPGLSLVWETIKNRRSKGIPYRRLADEITFSSFGLEINKRDVNKIGVMLRIVPQKLVRQKFFIIDSHAVFIFWDTPKGKPFPLSGSITALPECVKRCVKNFDELWLNAVPAESLFDKIEAFRPEFLLDCCQVLGESGKRVGNGLIEYGRFYFNEMREKEEKEVLLKAGLIKIIPDHRDVYIPGLARVIEECVGHVTGPKTEIRKEEIKE